MTLTLSFKYKVLSELVHDKDSTFHKLKAPNNVAKDVLPVVWRFLAPNWQVVFREAVKEKLFFYLGIIPK